MRIPDRGGFLAGPRVIGKRAGRSAAGLLLAAHTGAAGVPPQETPGMLAGYRLDEESATHWRLPRRLAEISGLAMTGDGRLLGHHDEAGVVFELDFRGGSVVKEFPVTDGDAAVPGDFEGIAVVEETVYLVTSGGRLYEFREGGDEEPVLFTVYATGVGRRCEIEGLTYDEGRRLLLLLCKRPLGDAPKGRLEVHAWSVDRRALDGDSGFAFTEEEVSRRLEGGESRASFRPSGIEWHAPSGNFIIVAAREQAVAEVTPEGRVVGARRFPAAWHRQIEGVSFAQDGALIVADEGTGGRGRLTVYPAASREVER